MTPLLAALAALFLATTPSLELRPGHGCGGLQVWAPGCLRGSVEALDDSEIRGLRVEIEGPGGVRMVSTDERDDFVQCGLPSAVYQVQARSKGMEPATAWVVVTDRPRPREVVDLALRREGSVDIVVEVLDPEGRGVPDTVVDLTRENLGDGFWFEKTDGLGNALFRGLVVPGTEVWVSARHEDFDGEASATGTIGRASGRHFALRFEPPPWRMVEIVTGRLVDETDRPVEGAALRTSEVTRHVSGFHEATTDREGRFRLLHVREGAYAFTVESPGRPKEVFPLLVRPAMGPVTVRLAASTRVWGRVVGAPEGERATELFVKPPGTGDCRRSGGRFLTMTWAAGLQPRFQEGTLSGESYEVFLPDGSWMIQAKAEKGDGAPGWKWSADALVEVAGQRELRVDLQAGSADPARECEELGIEVPSEKIVRARVVEADSGRPLAGREVYTSLGEWTSDANGDVEVRVFPTPAETLEVTGSEEWSAVSVELPERADEVLTIPLRRKAPCRWRFLDPSGVPLRFEPSIELRDRPGHVFQVAASDETCPEGEFELQLHTSRGRYLHPNPVVVPGPDIVVQLPAAGGLDLRVPELEIEFDEDWPRGVEVLLESLDDRESDPIVRRDQLYLGSLPVGRYRVTVTAADGRRWNGDAEVRDDETRTVILW